MPLTIKTGAMKVKDPSTGNYVDVDMSLGVDYAPIISPTFTGTPSAPTPASTDDSTRIATTEFVQDHIDELEAADASLQGSLDAVTPFDTTPISGSTKGVTSGGVFTAITKDNLSAKIFNDSNNVISNLNSCVPGANFYNINTLNIPVANAYGTCYGLRSGSWHYQVAISNTGKIFIRCYTTSWSSWESINEIETGTITSSVFTNASVYSGSFVRKQGKIVNLSIITNAQQTSINKNYAETLFNIPSGYRPPVTVFAPCVYYINASTLTFTLASIRSNGDVGFFTPEDNRSIGFIRLIMSYIVN